MTGRTKHGIQSQVKMGNDITIKDHLHIIAGIPHSFVAASEKIKDRIEKNKGKYRKSKPDDDIQHQYISQHTLRRIVIFLSQLYRNQRGSPHSDQRTESRRKIHQRKCQSKPRNSHRTNPVTNKNTVYHVVKWRCGHSDNSRNGILHQEFSNLFGAQRSGRLLSCHTYYFEGAKIQIYLELKVKNKE